MWGWVSGDEPGGSEVTHTPVRTLADLDTLDEDEILDGYRDGFRGDPEPGDNRSRSYWHGWRNGNCDRSGAVPDSAMTALVREYVGRIRSAGSRDLKS